MRQPLDGLQGGGEQRRGPVGFVRQFLGLCVRIFLAVLAKLRCRRTISEADAIARNAASTASTSNAATEQREVKGTRGPGAVYADGGSSTAVDPKPDDDRITVEDWGDLGIAIDEHGQYLAVYPAPERYGVFPREKAKILKLPGKQWKGLLNGLARSNNGNKVEKRDIMERFGYLRAGYRHPIELPEPDGVSGDPDDDLPDRPAFGETHAILKTAQSRLTAAMADLGRKLRKQLNGPLGPGIPAVLSVAEEKYVESAFVVRHLVRGHDGKLRFGPERRDG